jgi:hypothetical protein
MSDDYLGTLLDGWKGSVRRHVRWLTRIPIVFLALTLVLHVLWPKGFEQFSEWLGFAQPSLATLLGVAILIFLLERVIVLEEGVLRPNVTTHATRLDAYRALSAVVDPSAVRRVDLIQFSGQTALPFLADVIRSSPHACIRLLLADPTMGSQFDRIGLLSHDQRINATKEQLHLLSEDCPAGSVEVETRHYNTPASISSLLIDDSVVVMGWYRVYADDADPMLLHLRGHNLPAVIAQGSAAAPLVTLAKNHFDSLWKAASKPTSSKV